MPFIGTVLKYISWNFFQDQTGKRNTTFFNFEGNFRGGKQFRMMQIVKNNTLYKDRFDEVRSFYQKNVGKMLLHFMINGTPNTKYYKQRLLRNFNETDLSKQHLKYVYEKAAFMYANRLMLRYHNYGLGKKILSLVKTLGLKKEQLQVLDYGCGVADASLYLAFHGIDVTIVDLDDSKFKFALSRFTRRNLNVHFCGASQTDLPVSLGKKKYDVIIMSEFLEHVCNPRIFLEFAINHLNDSLGILYDSLGPIHKHEVGGDHLKEAKDQMENTDYQKFHRENLTTVPSKFDVNYYKHFYSSKTIE